MYPFKQINQELVNLGEGLIKEWFPHAKKIGREWCVANINGSGDSSSLRINLEKGAFGVISLRGRHSRETSLSYIAKSMGWIMPQQEKS